MIIVIIIIVLLLRITKYLLFNGIVTIIVLLIWNNSFRIKITLQGVTVLNLKGIGRFQVKKMFRRTNDFIFPIHGKRL